MNIITIVTTAKVVCTYGYQNLHLIWEKLRQMFINISNQSTIYLRKIRPEKVRHILFDVAENFILFRYLVYMKIHNYLLKLLKE